MGGCCFFGLGENMETALLNEMDLDECVALFRDVFNAPPWNEAWKAESARRRLANCFSTPDFGGLAIRKEGRIIGFALGFIETWDTGEHFYLKEMCVARSCQRQGAGTLLITALEQWLSTKGIQKIYLHTARETFAQDFYEQRGFRVSAKTIMMTKWLNRDSLKNGSKLVK